MSEFRYPQPSNEHAFEEFCLVLMREVWSLPSLEQFGHRGERQHGVDLLDLGDSIELRAVQCKHHAAHKTLPPAELELEIRKALGMPDEPLAEYWVLTTAKKSTATQRKVREINKEHGAKGLFRVVVRFWDDIERMIDASPAAQRQLELRVPDAMISAVRSAVGDAITLTAGALHVDLDEAKAHLAVGELGDALLVLRKVRARSWADLSAGQKARWLTLSADIALREGKDEKAGRLLLQALEHTPGDELALINAVAAKRLVDDPTAAMMAAQAREKFPLSAAAWAAGIDMASTREDAVAIVNAMPGHLRNSEQVAIAIAGRIDLHVVFPDALVRAVEIAPKDARGWFHFGVHLLTTEARKLDMGSWEGAQVDHSLVAQAIEAFSKVAAICEVEARPALRTEALLHRASASSLLGDFKSVRADIEAANTIAPASGQVGLARAKLLLEEGSLTSAIPLLREVLQRGAGDDAYFVLASALWNRNSSGDREEATALMSAYAARRGDKGSSAHFMALDGMLATGRIDEARAFLDESVGRLDPAMHAVLEGRLCLAEGERETASNAATRALDSLTTEAPRRLVVWVSRLLVQIGRHQDALRLLDRLSTNVRDVESGQAFVLCASRLGRHSDVLGRCAQFRSAGVYDPYLLSVELPLLDRYDPQLALSVLEVLVGRDGSSHEARVHLVALAQRMDRRDLVLREIDNLPSVGTVDGPELGAAIVQILRAHGRTVDAMSYAYELLRRFFSNPHAHRAFIHSTLWRDRDTDDPSDFNPKQVIPGLAVCLQEPGEKDHWFVLEDSLLVASGVEHELTVTHDLWARLVGRDVGDEIELGLSRRARIAEVVPKTTFRFRDVMSRWQYRFPQHQELWMVRVGTAASGELDLSNLFEIANARRKRVEHGTCQRV